MLNNLNLERLHTFVLAARAPTFAAAAAQRGVSVSAVSQQVRALEGELGHALFERVGRRVRLTEEGRALLEVAATHLSAIEEAVSSLGRRHRALVGWVNLGSPRTFGQFWLGPRLSGLLRRAPGLRLRLRFEVPSVLERALLDGALDLALLARPSELPGLESQTLAQETFVAVTAPGPARRPLDEEAARALPWLLFSGDRPMHDAWWRASFGRRSRPQVDAVCEVPALELMLDLVQRGVGVAVLPDYLVRPALDRRNVKLLEVAAQRAAKSSLFLAWRRHVVRTARFEAVRQSLLEP
jgi:DNA-binding transcriptional LysR family regulator